MKKILIFPSTVRNRGTGHITRCLNLFRAVSNQGFFDVWIFQDEPGCGFDLEEILKENSLPVNRVTSDLNLYNWDLVVLDNFKTSGKYVKLLEKYTVLAIDEGGEGRKTFDYVLDIIPSGKTLDKNFNLYYPGFLSLPVNRKEKNLNLKEILLVIRGEKFKNAALKAAVKTATLFTESRVTALISGSPENLCKPGNLEITGYRENLKEELYKYDLVITYYGLTALEARAAGAKVILVSPGGLHKKLGRGEGFFTLPSLKLPEKVLVKIKKNPGLLLNGAGAFSDNNRKVSGCGAKDKPETLAGFVRKMDTGAIRLCPVCGRLSPVIHRFPERTFRRCPECSLVFQEVFFGSKMDYGEEYFFSQYQAQYGKSYLEDFQAIKKAGFERCSEIRKIIKTGTPVLLDIGCAYGPFLEAAKEKGFVPFGTDISEEACKYVSCRLGIPAVSSVFPDLNLNLLGSGDKFDVVSMWYVIEHFENLQEVLEKVSSIVKKGGVFCFSTPNYRGISGIKSSETFFKNSPSDHFTVWNKRAAKIILEKYGFKPVRFRFTGIHPERFPGKGYLKAGGKDLRGLKRFEYSTLFSLMKLLRLGDTFEVYGVKK